MLALACNVLQQLHFLKLRHFMVMMMMMVMMMVMMMMVMMMTKVVDLEDKTRELKYKSKMLNFLRQNWWPIL